MNWYAFYQQEGGEEDWHLILADSRERTIQQKKPQFTTALDVDNNFEADLTAEDLAKLHYRGPLYVDFDSLDITEAVTQFKRFLEKLEVNFNFDLQQASLFATGGKGFHVIIPEACWLPKVKPNGLLHLPYIFREMMQDEKLFVDTLDLRVYTGRRGRMFRTTNVQRKNGKYKVPITVEEAKALTEAQYHELVKAPRPEITPAKPTLNDDLAVLFQVSSEKFEGLLKARKKNQRDDKLIKKFDGKTPPTIKAIMSGEAVNHSVGFHKIALQLAVTAHALGQSEEQLLSQCDGLVANHQSDGDRYNTPAKRRRELSRMWHVMHENPAYQFTVAGIKSVVNKDVTMSDLDSGGVDFEEEEEADADLDPSLLQGLRVTSKGIFRNTEDGLVKVCSMGLSEPKQLLDLRTDEVIGYEVKVHVNGKAKGSKVLEMGMFTSRAKFMGFTLAAAGASMSANDMQVGALADILRARADKSGEKMYTVISEGLDVLLRPDSQIDVVWADRFGVRSRLQENYKLVGAMTAETEFSTDLAMSPELEDTEETREFFKQLFAINTVEIVSKMFSWYLMCFFSQPVRHIFNQFPFLQVYGQAGSGKSKTSELFNRMHYYLKKPKIQSAISITPFALEAFASGSASIPLVLDEYKPRQMKKDRLDRLQGLIRDNYTATEMNKGRVTSESGASKLVLKSSRNAAPISTIGEAAELQPAIMERGIMVPFSKDSKRGHLAAFQHCQLNAEILGSLGRMCMEMALQVNIKKFGTTILKNRNFVEQEIGERAHDTDRPIFNSAVHLTGLDIGEALFAKVFGAEFLKEEFARMRDAALGDPEKLVPRQMSELARVVDTLSHLSYIADIDDKNRLQIGVDYLPVPQNGTLELAMRSCWDKYARYRRSIGEEILFDTYDAFVHSCLSSGAVIDRASIHSGLKMSSSTLVYTFGRHWLDGEGVSDFKL